MADSSVQDQFEAQAKCLQQHGVQPVRRRAAAAHAAAPRQRALGTACRRCGPLATAWPEAAARRVSHT